MDEIKRDEHTTGALAHVNLLAADGDSLRIPIDDEAGERLARPGCGVCLCQYKVPFDLSRVKTKEPSISK